MKTTQRIHLTQLRHWGLVLAFTLVTSLVGTAALAATQAPAPADIQKRQADFFQVLDANHDGKLDRKEFLKITEYSARLKDEPDRADSLFGVLDKNGDDKLTREEYLVIIALSARQNQPNSPAPKPAAAVAASKAAEKPPTPQEIDFFEKKIRPVLADHCYKCHSADAEKLKGSLLVDTREGIRSSGDSGHAVVPGDVEGSLLIKAIRYTDSELQMPPKKDGAKLPDEVIANFEQWVKMGAPDPRDGKVVAKKTWDMEKGREHWSFQPPQKSAPPAVKDTAWAKSDIDRFVLAGLEQHELKPVGDADARTLLRRVYFDLIGLPPSPEEVETFAKDKNPKAFEKVVDKLLASPQYGERWSRHWLDVARYAESSGKEINIAYPHAWRYRDYVIKAFNDDKPYDRFLKEQIAGDLLPIKDDTQWAEHLVATGFLAIGPKSHNTRDSRQFALDVADEQIDAVSQGMLGLTVACARCHDHKFDPVPQADYYALAGIFLSTETRFGTPRYIQNNQVAPLIALPETAKVAPALAFSPQEIEGMERRLAQFEKQRDDALEEARAKGERSFGNPRVQGATIQIAILEKLLDRYDETGKPNKHLAMGVQEKTYTRDTALLQRGEMDKPLDTVPRGFVQVLSRKEPAKISNGSGRLELANWIASRDNPLTARVMANRVWLHLFDKGIVPTPDNFGTTGQAPTDQKLLDTLAVKFMDNGWSVKKLVREMVLSRTYQLASDYSEASYAVDPDNAWHWRMSKRRLDAESIRDAMLSIAGKLDLAPPQASPVAKVEGSVLLALRPQGGGGRPGMRSMGAGAPPPDPTYRSVYLPIVRDQAPEALATFDFAESSLVVGDREDTTVPSQALYLMNNATVQKLSEAMADRLLAKKLRGAELGKAAFSTAYSRPPTQGELKATTDFFAKFNAAEAKNFGNQDQLGRAGLVAFCQALLGSAEFRYLN